MAMAVGLLLLYSNYYESPKEMALRNELREMEYYYNDLQNKTSELDRITADMAQRDDNIYRVVL